MGAEAYPKVLVRNERRSGRVATAAPPSSWSGRERGRRRARQPAGAGPARGHAVGAREVADPALERERSARCVRGGAKNPPTTTTAIAPRLPSMNRATADAVLGARGPLARAAITWGMLP
jgi:hypothetical protein